MQEGLNEEWAAFQQVLIDSDIMLQKQKTMFKRSLVLSYEELKKKTDATVEEFNTKGNTHASGLVLTRLSLHGHECVCLYVVLIGFYLHISVRPGPFQSTLSIDSALKLIAEHHIQLEALKEKENTILDELTFFKIKQPPSKKIQMLEKVRINSI